MDSCPACAQQVPGGANYCPSCGAPLATACPGCGAVLPADARFCPTCGTSVPSDLAARTSATEPQTPAPALAPEGERRQLTVAFCDIVGSTELSGRMDHEEYGELIRDYQRRVSEVVQAYGGEIENFMGDGVVMRFGWPEAHDDDPERAVRAALELVDRLAEPEGEEERIEVRIGVHTGPVVIGESGGETMALGETVNVAARLQGLAGPGSVAISAATLELVRGIFVTEELGSHELRGVAEPIHAHRVLQPSGVRSRFDSARGALTQFIGREVEIGVLAKRWEQAQSQGGQAVLIIGEPGVGKSRLTYELRERIRGEAHTWLECACSSYTQESAFRPAIELIEEGLQLRPDEPLDERLTKIRRGFEIAGVGSSDAVALIANLLAIPVSEGIAPLSMSPERRRQRTIEVLVEWVLTLARMQPMVLFVEDLHWADASTLELVEELIARSRGSRLMLLCSARPEFIPPWGARANLTSLSLSPLSEEEVREMVGALVSGRTLPEPLVERIIDETAGIPLYAEEVGRMVLESDVLVESEGRLELAAPLSELDIPTTLQGSLMARLDRLSTAKRVAQLAAVIGREFSYELLAEISELGAAGLRNGLARLVDSEILFQEGDPPRSRYSFKHVLIQEAAYESLLKRTRRSLHERIAQELQRRRGEEPLAVPEVIARHYEAAGRLEPAVQSYRVAAEQAARHSGHREAIALLTKAIELLAELPSSREQDEREVEMQIALGASIIATRSYADPAIEAAYERALRLCEGLENDRQVANALAGLSIFYLNRGQLDTGAELAERVLEIGQLADDSTLMLLGHIQLALPRILTAEFEVALEHADRAAAIYDPEREQHREIAYRFGTDHGVVAHCFAGWSLMGLGFLDQALDRMHGAVALARTIGHPFSLAYAWLFETTVHWIRGDLDARRATAEATLAISEEQGFDLWRGLARVHLGSARAIQTGDPATLPDVLEGSLVAGETGNRAGSTPVLASVAEAQVAVGDVGAAIVTLDAALAVSVETAQTWWDPELYRLKGELALLSNGGDGDEAGEAVAERHLRRAIELARVQRSPLHELRAATSLASLLREREPAPALKLLQPVYERFSEGFETRPLREARRVLEELGAAPPAPPAPRPGPAASVDQLAGNPSLG